MMMERRCMTAIVSGLAMWVLGAAPAAADSVSIGVSTPDVSFSLNVGSRPQLVAVPGLPVYHAPSVQHNYFFYSGHYYVLHNGVWLSSVQYNGPWVVVHQVPQPVLAVPVTYYKIPPGHAKKGEHWKEKGDHGKGKGKKKWKDD